MANVERTVNIIFAGESKELKNTLTEINQGLELLGKVVDGVIGPLADAAHGVQNLDSALANLATTIGTEALNAFSEYQAAMIDVQRLMGDEIDRMEEVEDAVRSMSKEYGESMTTIMKASGEFKRAGFEVNETLEMTNGAIKMMVAGNTDLGTATQSLIQIFKGFNFDAREVEHTVDALVNVSLNYATNIEKLSIAVAELSGIMHEMGYTFDEVVGLATPIIEVFQSGEEAATSLKTALARLSSGTAPVAQAFDDLGLSLRDDNDELKSGKQLMNELTTALAELNDTEKLYYINKVTGIRQAQKLIFVMSDQKTVIEATEAALNSAGKAQEQVNMRMEAFDKVVSKYDKAAERLSITLGESLEPAAREVYDALTQLYDVLEQEIRIGAFDELQSALTETAKKVKKFIDDVANALPDALKGIDWSGLIESWNRLTDELLKFLNSIDVSNPEELKNVLQKVVDTGESLINTTIGMVKSIEDLANQIWAVIEAYNKLSPEQQENIGRLIQEADLFQRLGFFAKMALQAIEESSGDTYTGLRELHDATTMWGDLFKSAVAAIKVGFNETQLELLNYKIKEQGLTDELKSEYEMRVENLKQAHKDSGESYNQFSEKVDRYTQSWYKSQDEMNKKLKESTNAIKTTDEQAKKFVDTSRYLRGEIESIPGVKVIKIEDYGTIQEFKQQLTEANNYLLVEMPDNKYIYISGEMDEESFQQIKDYFDREIPDEKKVKVNVDIDEKRLKEIEDLLDKAMPKEKKSRLILEGIESVEGELNKLDTGFKNVLGDDGVRHVRITWLEDERQKIQQQLNDLKEHLKQVTKEGAEPDAWETKILMQGIKEAEEQVDALTKKIEDEIPSEKEVDIKTEINEEALRYAAQKLKDGVPDEIVVDIILAGIEQFKAQTEQYEAETERMSEAMQYSAEISIAALKEETAQFKSAMDGLGNSIAAVGGVAQDMFKSIVDLLRDIVTSTKQASTEMDMFGRSVDGAASDLQGMYDTVKSWLDSIEQIEEELRKWEAHMDELERQHDAINRALKDIENSESILNDYQRERNDLTEDEKATIEAISKATQRLMELEQERLEIEQKITDLKQEQSDYESTIYKYMDSETKAQLELIEDKKKLGILTEDKAEEAKLKAIEGKKIYVGGKKVDLSDAFSHIQEMEDEAKKLEDQLKIIEDDMDKQEKTVDLLEERLEIEQEIVKAKEDYTRLLKEEADLVDEIVGNLKSEEELIADCEELWGKVLDKLKDIHDQGKITNDEFRDTTTYLNDWLDQWINKWNDALLKTRQDLLDLNSEANLQTTGGVDSWMRDQVSKLFGVLNKQMQMENNLVNAQIRLADKQAALIDARIRALERGDSVISVDGAGLQPELEAFMWKILETIQVRANAEYSEFLLGISGMTTGLTSTTG